MVRSLTSREETTEAVVNAAMVEEAAAMEDREDATPSEHARTAVVKEAEVAEGRHLAEGRHPAEDHHPAVDPKVVSGNSREGTTAGKANPKRNLATTALSDGTLLQTIATPVEVILLIPTMEVLARSPHPPSSSLQARPKRSGTDPLCG